MSSRPQRLACVSETDWPNIRAVVLPSAQFADFAAQQLDPKNRTIPIDKNDVLQVANYLKPQGAGQFGIIVCRLGADQGALITRQEQWMQYQKLVLILDDSDVESMLLAQSAGGDPSKILSDWIQDFRLSI